MDSSKSVGRLSPGDYLSEDRKMRAIVTPPFLPAAAGFPQSKYRSYTVRIYTANFDFIPWKILKTEQFEELIDAHLYALDSVKNPLWTILQA
jgi:hypothetical protein